MMTMNIVAIALHTITVANDTIMVVQLPPCQAANNCILQVSGADRDDGSIIFRNHYRELVYNKEQERCFAAMPMPSRPDITYRIADNGGSALTPKIIERGHWLNSVRLHEGRKKAKGILLLHLKYMQIAHCECCPVESSSKSDKEAAARFSSWTQ